MLHQEIAPNAYQIDEGLKQSMKREDQITS